MKTIKVCSVLTFGILIATLIFMINGIIAPYDYEMIDVEEQKEEIRKYQEEIDRNIAQIKEDQDQIQELLKQLDDLSQRLNEMEKYYNIVYKVSEITGLSASVSETIISRSEKTGIPLHIILGVYDYESRFNPEAKNPVSTATGLGQILHKTAKWVCTSRGIEYDRSKLTDPVYNVHLTTEYMSMLKEKYSRYDDWIIKMLKEYGDQSDTYIPRVLERANKYKELLNEVDYYEDER